MFVYKLSFLLKFSQSTQAVLIQRFAPATFTTIFHNANLESLFVGLIFLGLKVYNIPLLYHFDLEQYFFSVKTNAVDAV